MDEHTDLQTVARLREATYGPTGTEIYYEDGDTYRDITDLYTVLKQNRADTGSPSLENGQVESLARTVYENRPLSLVEIGLLAKLKGKYADALAQLRAIPDRDGQDYLAVPDPATARLVGGTS